MARSTPGGRAVRAAVFMTIAVAAFWMAASPAHAQSNAAFGVRFGASVNPDQIIAGVHVKTGEVAPDLYFFPSGTIGFGDDVTTFQANADVRYEIPFENTPWLFYAGGGFGVAGYSDGGSSTGAGVNVIMGVESHYRVKNSFLAEVRAGIGNLPDIEFVFGITFH